MLPPTNDRNDGCSAARLRIQKKTYRAFKTLTEPDRRRKILLMACVATPVERLQRELCFLDGAGNGLFDACMYSDDLNPFSKCRRTLIRNLRAGKAGEYASLFASFGLDEHFSLMQEIKAMTLAWSGQVEFPRRWARYYHPAADVATKQETLDQFVLGHHSCCRRICCGNVHGAFGASADS